jgi:fluoroquinolone transport system permease protein
MILMSNLVVLLQGEFQRMKKYNILGASILVAIIWIGVLHFSNLEDISNLFPLLIFLDSTSMSILMVGVTMFFEKQEGVLKTLLVSPISKAEYILSKTISNISSNILTLIFLYIYAVIFKEINVNILVLTLSVILIAFFHSMIGFLLTYYSKDFTDLLVGMIKYSFILMIPVLLNELGIIKNEIFSKVLYVIPTKSSMLLLNASATKINLIELLFAISYLVIGAWGLFRLVNKRFDAFAIKESGV